MNWMKDAVLFALVSGALSMAAPQPTKPTAALPPPSISIAVPIFSTVNHEFVARVDPRGCSPGTLDWTLSKGCKLIAKAGMRAIVQCTDKGYQTIKVVARGGGCNKATATSQVLVNREGGVTVFFPCGRNERLPSAIVIPPQGIEKWYYRPSAQSAGRVGISLMNERTVTLGCEDNK